MLHLLRSREIFKDQKEVVLTQKIEVGVLVGQVVKLLKNQGYGETEISKLWSHHCNISSANE